ncbi:MAG: pyridoxamine 5'-phosphate oxidase family protein [Actinomycetota bacterium]
MSSADPVEILDDDECWELLSSTLVGRLAVDVGGQPDIFPINYLVDGREIVFRSGAGTKLAAAVLMHHVAFEIDGYLPEERMAWSVIVKGRAHEIERMEERYAADDLPLFPWIATDKPTFVRITPNSVTGRRFHVVDSVDVDGSLGRP